MAPLSSSTLPVVRTPGASALALSLNSQLTLRLPRQLHVDDGQRVADDELVVQVDFDVIRTEGFELDVGEKVHVRRHRVHFLEAKIDGAFAEHFFIGRKQLGGLFELADAVAPASPQAKFEEADGDLRRRHGVDDTDERLHPGDFAADIFAEDGGLAVW